MRASQRTYSTRNKHGTARRSVSAVGEGQDVAVGQVAEEITEEVVEAERQRMIAERKSDTARVLDKHDDLLREAFHLKHFKLMTDFNPKIAKTDNSAVFLKYKAQYDLLDSAATSETARKTRRARNERAQGLQADVPSASAPPGPSKKSKRPADDDDPIFWKIYEEVKPKHKGKGKGKEREEGPLPESISAAPSLGRGRGRKKSVAQEPLDAGSASSVDSHSRRRSAMGPPPGLPTPRKKRKLQHAESDVEPGENGNTATAPQEAGTTGHAVPISDRVRTLRGTVRAERSIAEAIAALPPTPSSPLKRIKLIVRRPEPMFTSPIQKPLPQKFGGSLTAFLESYTAPKGADLDEAGCMALIRKDLRVWRTIDAMRRQGRMLYRPPDGDDVSRPEGVPAADRRLPDVWDAVIEAVGHRAQAPRVRGEHVAAQVVACVRAYWDQRAVREDKARAQDEKRLKALAKATMRMVVAEWKKAVFHIREQERLKREEEEKRRGQKHLDALIDQSGQLLEAQQVDLTKGDVQSSRSRSSSLADTLGRWASATPPPATEDGAASDGGTEIEESGDSGSESGSEGGDAVDSRFLVARSESVSETPGPADEEIIEISREEFSQSSGIRGAGHHNEGLTKPWSKAKTLASNADLSYPSEDDDAENFAISLVQVINQANGGEVNPTITKSKPPPQSNGHAISEHLLNRGSNVDRPPRHASAASRPVKVLSPASPAQQVIEIPDDVSDAPPPDMPITQSEAAMDLDAAAGGLDTVPDEPDVAEEEDEEDASIPVYLRPYAVAPVEWDPQEKIKPPLLLRGNLRPYQHAGLEWLATLHTNNVNGILADEMGLGKTIQTISLLAHLACDRGIWGPHLIVVPTSVILNWEMEFKKFLPGFKVLSYHGNTKRRKELRQGWNNKYHFNVCVTSYTLASRDAHVFKRKPWYYMILDEAHMIKNFKSQRWNILLMFRSFRRLLLTGTPLQNNLTELWALLQFLMSGTNFANLKEFGDWFANPLEKAIEMGTVMDEEMQQRVTKLHSVLRPYLLRRLKRDVEKELPSKFEHLVMCPLSKRQRFLYDEFMSRAETRHDLQSGVYQKIANILMQLRKVVNHPDLFEVRPIRTSFAMSKSAIADYEIKEFLVRRALLREDNEQKVNLDLLGLVWINREGGSVHTAFSTQVLDATPSLPRITDLADPPPPRDVRTIAGYRRYKAYTERAALAARWDQIRYVNHLRCQQDPPLFCEQVISLTSQLYAPLVPYSALDRRFETIETSDRLCRAVKSYSERADEMADMVDHFAFVTPSVVARDLTDIALSGHQHSLAQYASDVEFDASLHRSSVKLQIAFPDPSLLQYDCGKLQELDRLLRERKAGGHRILIFTQMTRILDILEIFLNLHGYLYLRLDGATKIEDRQYITERFNTDTRIFCFISSSRSGGVGINLTGADTVIFYDSDFNPQMDRQCEDRAHRIGQIRDVHIYRFISSHTVEEALLRKANQKRSLDDIVIQKGEFDWRTLFGDDGTGVSTGSGLELGTVGGGGSGISVSALERALGEFEDSEDRVAREVATREEVELTGADEADFDDENKVRKSVSIAVDAENDPEDEPEQHTSEPQAATEPGEEEEEEEGGTTVEYMLSFIEREKEYFSEWRV